MKKYTLFLSLLIFILSLTMATAYTEPTYTTVSGCNDPSLDTGGKDCVEWNACPEYKLRESNKYYLLTDNLFSNGTCADIIPTNSVIDLNGYTITYGNTGITGIPNHDFNSGTANWDLSGASATIGIDDYIYLEGDNLLKITDTGGSQTVYSDWITINTPGSYTGSAIFYPCDGWGIAVEEQGGGNACSATNDHNCEFTVDAPGQYRLALTVTDGHAVPLGTNPTSCYIDFADINPTAKNGIRIHDSSAHDVTIKNGRIISGGRGSWYGSAIYIRPSENDNFVIDHIFSEVGGYDESNAYLSYVDNLEIKDSVFVNNNPYTEDRHGLHGPVHMIATKVGSIHNNQFIGGQGFLMFVGNGANLMDFEIYENYFAASTAVTNHYAITLWSATDFIIRDNVFEQESSGIELGKFTTGAHIYNNQFKLDSMNCLAEDYYQYTTAAFRITDYNTPSNEPGVNNNIIENNYIEGVAFEDPNKPHCTPAIIGLHLANLGRNNTYRNNTFNLSVLDDNSEVMGIWGGGNNIGNFINNHFITNYIDIWVGSPYMRSAYNGYFENNIFESQPDSTYRKHTIQLGDNTYSQQDIIFLNNTYKGVASADYVTGDGAAYTPEFSIKWWLHVFVQDSDSEPLQNAEVRAYSGQESITGTTNNEGHVWLALNEMDVTIPSLTYYNNGFDQSYWDITPFTPHNIEVTYEGETQSYPSAVEMDASKMITFNFETGPCTEGNTRQCGATDVGICEYGTQTCTSGTWGNCVGEVTATTEVCDNSLDDDCDGLTDTADAADCTSPPSSCTLTYDSGECDCLSGTELINAIQGWYSNSIDLTMLINHVTLWKTNSACSS